MYGCFPGSYPEGAFVPVAHAVTRSLTNRGLGSTPAPLSCSTAPATRLLLTFPARATTSRTWASWAGSWTYACTALPTVSCMAATVAGSGVGRDGTAEAHVRRDMGRRRMCWRSTVRKARLCRRCMQCNADQWDLTCTQRHSTTHSWASNEPTPRPLYALRTSTHDTNTPLASPLITALSHRPPDTCCPP